MQDLGINIEYYGDCLVQTMPNYTEFQFNLAFGNVWKKCNKENLEALLDSVTSQDQNSLFQNISLIRDLWKQEKVSSPYSINYLLNIELPSYKRGKGIGSRVLKQLINRSKEKRFEYLLCNAVTSDGNKLVQRNGFENIQGTYWGIKI
jgi:hypothetical protein